MEFYVMGEKIFYSLRKEIGDIFALLGIEKWNNT